MLDPRIETGMLYKVDNSIFPSQTAGWKVTLDLIHHMDNLLIYFISK